MSYSQPNARRCGFTGDGTRTYRSFSTPSGQDNNNFAADVKEMGDAAAVANQTGQRG
jgi:hypothetical protein